MPNIYLDIFSEATIIGFIGTCLRRKSIRAISKRDIGWIDGWMDLDYAFEDTERKAFNEEHQ